MAKLIVVEGPDTGSEYELPLKEPGSGDGPPRITAGRDQETDIPLNDPAISREHFQLEAVGRAYRLVDLGSRNRTFVNGETVREQVLENGDVVRIGDTELRFECSREVATSDGVVSTIIKEIPALRQGGSFIEKVGLLERHMDEERKRQMLGSVQKLFDLYAQIATTSTIPELFQKLLEGVAPALSAETAGVLTEEDGNWVLQAKYPPQAGHGAIFSSSIVAQVARDTKAVLSRHTQDDERFREKQSVVGEEIVTAMAVPVVVAGHTFCVLYADRRGAGEPFTEEDLQLLAAVAEPAGALLERLQAEKRLRQENRTLFRSLTEEKKIIGPSREMESVFEFVRKAAPTPMTVLIQGETGTGKELVASAIHYNSPRAGNPFVAINCAALPENLVESELFGHERGAFTGAVAKRKGRFELAHTGTVFLDEIGELSLACQAKLLRLLEERNFERVGGTQPIQVDVRVIAATNRDLLAAVGEGLFREDLYYRLGVLNVRLPPLSERLEDLPPLVDHFIQECCGGVKSLSDAALAKLKAYPWPGNVRQLRNVIESAVVLGDGPRIGPEELVLPEAQAARPRAKSDEKAMTWKPVSLAQTEKEHIERVLKHTGGNKKKASEILGIERCTLYAKIKSYEIQT
jgi:Nif-specific regulatory protein